MIAACQAKLDPDIEAAFMAHYGLDTLSRDVTPRRVHVLGMRLPAGAWPDPESAASWSVESHLLAAVLDSVNQLAWITVSANSKRPPKRPKPTPRPGPQVKEKPRTMMEVMREIANTSGIKVHRSGGETSE